MSISQMAGVSPHGSVSIPTAASFLLVRFEQNSHGIVVIILKTICWWNIYEGHTENGWGGRVSKDGT
jgi:hypothetical protein